MSRIKNSRKYGVTMAYHDRYPNSLGASNYNESAFQFRRNKICWIEKCTSPNNRPSNIRKCLQMKKTDIPKNRNSIVFGTPPWCENTLCHASFLFVLICLIEGDVLLTSILGPTSYFICILCYRYKDYGVCRAPEIWKGVTYSQLHGAHSNC